MRDRHFQTAACERGSFAFDTAVARVFDDMLVRSIPFYAEQQAMIAELGNRFWKPGTSLYDLGCSTGTTLVALARAIPEAPRLVGYDASEPMLERAARRVREAGLGHRIALRRSDLATNPAATELSDAGVVTLCWTLHFVSPLRRAGLIRWIHSQLVEGGALIVTEKVLADDPVLDRLFVQLYYDLKRRNGYSETEIERKREALENVLVPYRNADNLELFRRSGFEIVETFFQWYDFVGYLCVKRSG